MAACSQIDFLDRHDASNNERAHISNDGYRRRHLQDTALGPRHHNFWKKGVRIFLSPVMPCMLGIICMRCTRCTVWMFYMHGMFCTLYMCCMILCSVCSVTSSPTLQPKVIRIRVLCSQSHGKKPYVEATLKIEIPSGEGFGEKYSVFPLVPLLHTGNITSR